MPTEEVRLYQLAHSPFCLAIAKALEAVGVACVPINVSNGNRAAIIELTGGLSYEVPVLDDRGRVVFESSADSQDIARHVDSTWGSGRLFPDRWEGWQAIVNPHLEREIEGITFRLTDIHYVPAIPDAVERMMVTRHKERRFGRGCIERWRSEQDSLSAQAAEGLRPYDQMLGHTPFLTGSQPIYSDFLLHGILSNLTWNQWNPLPPLPHLGDWYARLGEFRYA